MSRLPSDISQALREGVYASKKAGYENDLGYRMQQSAQEMRRAEARRQELEARRRQIEADRIRYKDWFDASEINEDRPLDPVRVWNPGNPMGIDTNYDTRLERVRGWFQRGPTTTSYDTSRYKPGKAGDYIIAFGGAGSGRGDHDNWSLYGRQYGDEGNIAKFTWKQIPDAVKYALSLPKGSRLMVMGHSMGGHAALRFAKELEERGINIAGMDLRDPVRIDNRLVDFGKKALPWVDDRLEAPGNVTKGVNTYNAGWLNNFNPAKWRDFNISDLVSLAGNRINDLKNAGSNWIQNTTPKGKDHVEIGWMDLRNYFPYRRKFAPLKNPRYANPEKPSVKPDIQQTASAGGNPLAANR